MGRDVEGSARDLMGRTLYLHGGTAEHYGNSSRLSDQTLNSVPSKYDGVLTSRPRRSVTLLPTRNSGAVSDL